MRPIAACAGGSCRNAHTVAGHTGITRHSPRNGFNGLLRALPGDRACLSPSPPRKLVRPPGWGFVPPRRLDTGVEAPGPHDLSVRELKPFVRAPADRSRETPPCHQLCAQAQPASTAPRPAFRDDHDTPLWWDGMAGNIEVIWISEKQKYFFERDWTGQIRLIWLRKLDFRCKGFVERDRIFLTRPPAKGRKDHATALKLLRPDRMRNFYVRRVLF